MTLSFPTPTRVLLEQERTPREDAELVSVLVTVYNYQGLVTEALDSLLAQTHLQLEVIVVDDASTDRSPEVVAHWLGANAQRFERVLLIQHQENEGLPAARNTGFAQARAEYVLVLDADNGLHPRAIARLLETAQDGGFAVAYSQIEQFGANTRLGFADLWRRDLFRPANYVDAMALVAKWAWAEVGGYSHLDLGWEDFDLWCKFIEHELEGVFVPEILCRYRVHPASMLRTQTNRAEARIVDTMMMRHPWLKLLAGPTESHAP